MKKIFLSSLFCIMLMVIAYSQMQIAEQKKVLIEARDEVVIKAGRSSITLKKDGTILIKGDDIFLEGADKVNVKAAGDLILKGNKIKDN